MFEIFWISELSEVLERGRGTGLEVGPGTTALEVEAPGVISFFAVPFAAMAATIEAAVGTLRATGIAEEASFCLSSTFCVSESSFIPEEAFGATANLPRDLQHPYIMGSRDVPVPY